MANEFSDNPIECTIPSPHECGVTGSCNGWPRPGTHGYKYVSGETQPGRKEQVGGSHYRDLAPHEPFDVIDKWQTTWPPEVRFYLANVLKYLARLGRKGDKAKMREDIDKAIQYLTEARKRMSEIE